MRILLILFFIKVIEIASNKKGETKKTTDSLEEMVNSNMKQAIFYADAHFDKQSDRSLCELYDYISDNKAHIGYICDLGDGIDNAYMSKYPVDPEDIMNPQEQFDMYARHLSILDDISPRSSKYLMAGNHDKARLSCAKNLNRGIASLRNLQYENVLREAMVGAGIEDDKFFFCDRAQDIKLTKSNIITIMHGDPKLNPFIKGGVTGLRRTAETYPNGNTIIMGHGHSYKLFPREYAGKDTIQIGCMADIHKLEAMYLNEHPYSNGFGIMHYDKKKDKVFWEYKEIK